jgi:ribonuclease VapC
MVIDTSAFLAILTNEPERRRFVESIEAAESRLVSAATFVETSIALESRYGPEGLRDFDLFLTKAGTEIVSVDSEQAHAARRAFSRFGKGRHRAALNYGDCFSYALATTKAEPLLYKGDDFGYTDVATVR